jgi:predicted metalloprotease with PDZ domain
MEARLLATKDSGWPCDRKYDGIGVSGMDGLPLWDVAEDGPAWIAGIRVGDTVRGLDGFYPNQHPVGTKVYVEKLEGSRWRRLTITTGTICQYN